MVVNRRSPLGLGYVGFPALIFIELNQYGVKDTTYEELRRRQHKIYSYLKAYLPDFFDKDGKREFYNDEIHVLLEGVAERINETRDLYSPFYEGIHTWTDDEKTFQISLDGAFEELVVIISKTHVIDKEKIEGEEMGF
jgi:hypothetical protein